VPGSFGCGACLASPSHIVARFPSQHACGKIPHILLTRGEHPMSTVRPGLHADFLAATSMPLCRIQPYPLLWSPFFPVLSCPSPDVSSLAQPWFRGWPDAPLPPPP